VRCGSINQYGQVCTSTSWAFRTCCDARFVLGFVYRHGHSIGGGQMIEHRDRGTRFDLDLRAVLGGLALITGLLLFITWAVAQMIVNSIVGL
jgi:hypothetical protein